MALDPNEPSAVGPKWGLILSFPDQSASFAHGFEAGKIWNDMQRGGQAELAYHTSPENRELIRRMADHLGWVVESKPSTEVEEWDVTMLAKIRPERERANPHGLRIVE
jgi:hypothetical protein